MDTYAFSRSSIVLFFEVRRIGEHNSIAALVHLNLKAQDLLATEDTAPLELTTMLQVNKTLIHLDLSGNCNFSAGVCVFQGLQHNTSLVYLNLRSTVQDL